MHTPDGLLTSWVCVVGYILAALGITTAFVKFRDSLTKNNIIRMSSFAGLIFVLQMLNFPITGGTSGHIIGASIVAILMGPYAAIIVMSSVLLVQTIMFGDGGALALGINILNMGIIASFVSHYTYRLLKANDTLAVISASWLGIMAASTAVAVELTLSGAPLLEALSAMTFYHTIIGIGEAIITLAIVKYFADWTATKISIGAAVGIILGIIILPLVSGYPDGLQTVAFNLGFYSGAQTVALLSYTWIGGLIGALLTGTLCYGASRVLSRSLPRIL